MPIHVPPIYSSPFLAIKSPFDQIYVAGGNFQDVSGTPLSLGWLEWRLNHDSNVCVLGAPIGNQVIAGTIIKINLDQSGNAALTQIWPNDKLTPEGSYYTVRAFNSQGLEVWAVPQLFVLKGYTSGHVVNIGTLTPLEP